MTRRSIHSDSSRKGKAVEQLIAAWCVLGTNGELNAWTSLVDDEGVDLVFQRRNASKTLAVQVKSRLTTAKGLAERQRFQSQVRKVTLRARPDLYVLFVVADPARFALGPVWFIPSRKFVRKARVGSNNKHRFVASAREGTEDMWAPFLVPPTELPKRVLRTLKELP